MNQEETHWQPDPLFEIAEKLSADFSLFPEYEDNEVDFLVKGLLTPEECAIRLEALSHLTIDDYIEQVVSPSEKANRYGHRNRLRLQRSKAGRLLLLR